MGSAVKQKKLLAGEAGGVVEEGGSVCAPSTQKEVGGEARDWGVQLPQVNVGEIRYPEIPLRLFRDLIQRREGLNQLKKPKTKQTNKNNPMP